MGNNIDASLTPGQVKRLLNEKIPDDIDKLWDLIEKTVKTHREIDHRVGEAIKNKYNQSGVQILKKIKLQVKDRITDLEAEYIARNDNVPTQSSPA